MLSQCIACARQEQSCCNHVDIFLTGGDIERISRMRPAEDFYRWAPLTAEYEDGGGDPTWNALILNADRQRRILSHKNKGECYFLTETGCSLPSEVRPLLCRIYPYDFRESGLCGISTSCPVATEKDWLSILEASEMHQANAQRWVCQLYAEIYADRSDLTLGAA